MGDRQLLSSIDDVGYAESGDGLIAYSTVGEGPIDLMWVLTGNSHLLTLIEIPFIRRMVERMAEFSRVIMYDARGAGLSDPIAPGSVPTLEERTDEIRAVLDAAESRNVALFGYGVGGPAAIVCAATMPNRVSSLILQDTYARWVRDQDYPQGIPTQTASPVLEEIVRLWGTGATLDFLAPSAAGDEELKKTWGKVERQTGTPNAIRLLSKAFFESDVRDILPSLRVPTLVIHHKDSWVRPDHGRYLAEHIPDAQYSEVSGADYYWITAEDRELIGGEIEEFVTGVRRPPASDRVLATVLFTDIVDSTARAAEIGDHAWRDLLDRHDDVVRRQLDRHRGVWVKHTGDGVAATFDGPARGVICACAIRDALRPLGLEVRAGLHTGEVERRGDDVSGVGAHIAARVSALAGAGEVLVSSTVKDLVVGSGIAFEDRGMHALKGVPDQWRLLSVVG